MLTSLTLNVTPYVPFQWIVLSRFEIVEVESVKIKECQVVLALRYTSQKTVFFILDLVNNYISLKSFATLSA
jgi:hypothetical protein